MVFELWQTVGLIGVIFASTLLQSATGFGFGMVSMAVLPLFLPFPAVSMGLPLIMIPALAANFFARWRLFRWRPTLPLAAGIALGMAPGVYVLAELDEDLLKHILGVALVASVAVRVVGGRLFRTAGAEEGADDRRPHGWIGTSCGFLSGLLGGAFNIGGPPVIYYLYSRPWPPAQIIASLQGLFLLTAVLKVALGMGSNILGEGAVGVALAGLVPMAAATFLGIRLSSKLSGEWLRITAFIFIGLVGAKLAIFG